MTTGAPALIWCPFASAEEAAAIARVSLGARLVACANILPRLSSLFVGTGECREGGEIGALFKTEGMLLKTRAAA